MSDQHDEGAEGDRWLTAEMECALCAHAWVAVYPETAPRLECPSCGYMNRRIDELAKDIT